MFNDISKTENKIESLVKRIRKWLLELNKEIWKYLKKLTVPVLSVIIQFIQGFKP